MSSSSSWEPPTRVNTNTLRFLSTMRQPFSYPSTSKMRQKDISKSGMYSTPEERTPRKPFSPSHFRSADSSATPPTIEQIAMGLHVSRTPHLRPISKRRNSAPASPASPSVGHPYETSRRLALPRVHPPVPSRSSLKKTGPSASADTITPTTTPGLSVASMSSSTVTSATLFTPQIHRSVVSLKSRMSRFLSGSRHLPSSAPQSPTSSPTDSAVDLPPRKKAVRFSTSTPGLDETV